MNGEGAKFDLMATWRRTLSVLKSHWALFSAIAGPMVFVPLAAAFLRLASSDVNWSSKNAVLVEQQLVTALTNDAWMYLLLYLVFVIGQLAMMTLVLHRNRPTVGQAIGLAAVMTPSYLLAYMAVQLVTSIPGQLIQSVPTIAAIGGFVLTVISVILAVRTYVLSAVYAAGEGLNPLTNLKTAWVMTKGHALPLFGLLFIVGIGAFVSGLIIWFIASLLLTNVVPVSAAPAIMLVLLAIVLTLMTLLFVSLCIAVYEELTGKSVA